MKHAACVRILEEAPPCAMSGFELELVLEWLTVRGYTAAARELRAESESAATTPSSAAAAAPCRLSSLLAAANNLHKEE